MRYQVQFFIVSNCYIFFEEEYARLKRLGNDVQYDGDGNLIQEQDCTNYAVQRNEGRSQHQELMPVLVGGDVFRGLGPAANVLALEQLIGQYEEGRQWDVHIIQI